MNAQKLKNITKTDEWKAAEWDYSEIIAAYQFPLLGERPSPEIMAGRMDEILKSCPQYFPASLLRGQLSIIEGNDELAEQSYDQGIEGMLVLLEGEELFDTIEHIVDFLEDELRFDLCCKYLRKFIQRFPKKALYYDYLAGDILRSRTAEYDEVLTFQAKALEMEPESPTFLSNQAWIYLCAGRLKEAEPVLKKALEIRPDDRVARGNMEVLEYLKQKDEGTFFDFLLRPVNRQQLEKLQENDEDEECLRLCQDYNECRMAAFKQLLIKQSNYTAYQISNSTKTLIIFFRFVDEIMNSVDFLYEDIAEFHEYFEAIMHKFIFKHGDIDDEIFDDIYNSLTAFYDFLCQQKLIDKSDHKEFIKHINKLKPKLRKKMHRYNEIRHDDSISEKEKEAIRQELFDGDHEWPFL